MAIYLFFSFLFLCTYFGGGVMIDWFLFSVGGLDFSFSLVADYVSFGFFSCVSMISGLVFCYSVFYMSGSLDSRRFNWLVFGFVFSMFLLVFSGNFFLVMLGWDGLGLVSFCLVIFYSNHSSLESGLVTVFSNRVGDVFFLFCFSFFFWGGTFFHDLGSNTISGLFYFFLFLGAITKSAQAPFSAWLPMAMAAPTPVSSLVHSSTLVTAGVYVMVRFSFIFFFFDYVFLKVFFLLTMFVAGVCANLETDFKKIVAMSTLSQLGMMVFILSVGSWALCFLHMIVHALFKSMLFLSTGSLMSHLGGGQDSRLYGSEATSFGAVIFFLLSCLCLAGFPFFIGFYSKDLILLCSSYGFGSLFYLFFLGGCTLTVLYSIRLIRSGFSFFYKGFSFVSSQEDKNFFLPVSFLFFNSWILGGTFYWLFLSDLSMVFSFFDVISGVVVGLTGLFLSGRVFYRYNTSFFGFSISYLRWLSSGGTSFLFSKFPYHTFEVSWLDAMGGQGFYSFASAFSWSFNFFKYVSIGLILSLFLSLGFYV